MTDLVVVGGGKMGEALVGGLLRVGGWPLSAVTVVEPHGPRRDELTVAWPGLRVVSEPVEAEAAVVAVKPQQVVGVCAALAPLGVRRVLSIAAGVRLASMEAVLPAGTAVVRAMPNTPSLVGEGAAAICAGSEATEADLEWAESVLGAVGTVVRVPESSIDAVTGLSGSGPAYVFLIAEALIDAGVLAGLPRATADALARQTLLGAARLLAESDDGPLELRAAVTSPGGTTAAAVQVLEQRAVRAAVVDAVAAAARRSAELGA